MSWVAEKLKITNVLNDNDYNETPDNLNPEESSMSFSNKGYSLKPKIIIPGTSVNLIGTEAILKISYEANSNDNFDLMFDEFMSIIIKICEVFQLSNFEPTFEREKNSSVFVNAEVHFNVDLSTC